MRPTPLKSNVTLPKSPPCCLLLYSAHFLWFLCHTVDSAKPHVLWASEALPPLVFWLSSYPPGPSSFSPPLNGEVEELNPGFLPLIPWNSFPRWRTLFLRVSIINMTLAPLYPCRKFFQKISSTSHPMLESASWRTWTSTRDGRTIWPKPREGCWELKKTPLGPLGKCGL